MTEVVDSIVKDIVEAAEFRSDSLVRIDIEVVVEDIEAAVLAFLDNYVAAVA